MKNAVRTVSKKSFALLAVALLALAGAPLRAQTVPALLDAQGMIRDAAGNPVNGSSDVTFALFGAPTGGVALWSETQPGVQLNGGIFATSLGRLTPLPMSLFLNTATYLEVSVGGLILSPRQRLAASPYAVNSQYLQGHDPSYFVIKDAGTGFYGLGASPPQAPLHVKQTAAGPAAIIDNTTNDGVVLQLLGTGNGASLSVKPDAVYSSSVLSIGNGQNTYLRTDLGGSQVVIGGASPTPGVTLDVVGGGAKANQLCLGSDCRADVPDCQFFPGCPSGYIAVATSAFGSNTGSYFCCRP